MVSFKFLFSPRSLALFSSITILSLSAGYIALAWTEPTGTMPVTVAAPLNTGGVAQTKAGDLALAGSLTATMIYDADYNLYYVNPAGQTFLGGLQVKNPTGSLTTRFEGLSNSYASKLYISSASSGDGGMYYDASQNLMNIFSYGNLRFNVGTGNLSGAIANERMVITQAGNIGINTTDPYSVLNVGGSGTNLSNKGIIVGTVGDSISTNVPLYAETGRFEIGFPGWRDVEPLQIGAKIAAIRKNVYQPNSALIQGTDLTFYTGAGSTGNNAAFHDTSAERMRITYDGKVVIDNGGQLCIGTSCVASSTWATMVNNASGSGLTGGQIMVPVSLFDRDDDSSNYNPVGSCVQTWDPSSKKLAIVCGEGTGDVLNAQSSLSNPTITAYNTRNIYRLKSVYIGDVECTIFERNDDNPVLVCAKGSVTTNYCQEGHSSCIYDGWPVLPGSASRAPSDLATDGTNLYVSSGTYKWRISFDASGNATVAENGTSVAIPAVNGINVFSLGGESIPYNNVIYKVTLMPDSYFYIDCNSSTCRNRIGTAGFSAILFTPTGTY